MPHFICTACGMQYAESEKPAAQCVICEEERQYVPARGQSWTTLEALAQSHMNSFREYEPGVIGIGAGFAIGQRALLLRTVGRQRAVGLRRNARCRDGDGDQGARRHQGDRHFASAFLHHDGGVGARVRLPHPSQRRRPAMDHAAGPGDLSVGRRHAQTVGRRHADPLRRAFRRRQRCCIGRSARGAHGRGVVCSGDILTVATDRKWLSFMRSYPNFIPLSAREVAHIGKAMAPYAFDTLYGHYFDRVIATQAKSVLEKSVARYIAAVEGKRGYSASARPRESGDPALWRLKTKDWMPAFRLRALRFGDSNAP